MPLRIRRLRGPKSEMHTFLPLQIGNDPKQFTGGGISPWAKHLVQSFDVRFGVCGQLGKSDRGVDVITQQFFAERHLARKKAFDGFAKQTLAKSGITFRTRLNRLPKISR